MDRDLGLGEYPALPHICLHGLLLPFLLTFSNPVLCVACPQLQELFLASTTRPEVVHGSLGLGLGNDWELLPNIVTLTFLLQSPAWGRVVCSLKTTFPRVSVTVLLL